MITACWKFFGATVRGQGHIRTFTPNQDSFRISSRHWGDVAVVSDGVGSRPKADYGSASACRAVIFAARNWNEMDNNIELLISQIHNNWLVYIKPFEPQDCAATCLFAIRPSTDQMILGRLGDGLIGVLKTDGTYLELCEEKSGNFSNQTESLSEKNEMNQWQTISIAQDECCAVLLCTDGVSDDLLSEKRVDFVRHIYTQGKNIATTTAVHELRKMLQNWPVPKHSDDKTLVCLCKYEEKI